MRNRRVKEEVTDVGTVLVVLEAKDCLEGTVVCGRVIPKTT
jgi:hypothetical protein